MPQYNFGVGQLFIVPAGANPTPVNVGTLQDVSIDISRSPVEMYGANAFPEDVSLAKGKITGKAKAGRMQGTLIAALMAGSTTAVGQTGAAQNELGIIPATPFLITPVNSATFTQDGGVYDWTASKQLTCVASAPITGQYALTAAVVGASASFATSVMTCTIAPTTGTFQVGQTINATGVAAGTTITSLGTGTGGLGTYNLSTVPGTIAAESVTAGVAYLFALADVGHQVGLNYTYTITTGLTISLSNQPMGSAPTFQLAVANTSKGIQFGYKIWAVVFPKLSLAAKQDNYTEADFEFQAFSDSLNRVINFYTAAA
jgi:hypothetical protein